MLLIWPSPLANGEGGSFELKNYQMVLPDPMVMAGVVAKMSDAVAEVGGATARHYGGTFGFQCE